ncbi:hypothetical protein N7532_007221 [Penicillium argentinense]|uniref:Uncharacterized protein n=1 Tax=Penicillium argentinense TaxID=1131581 RepID=A0A9W9F7D2_9EURO|nr:uncharacterized protein N7532_007177 [Penicillium argentinense]XP_056473080.1 uncharacterized protein N7532_007221 [Penicillium argentinense]KAJ5094886.1 hypothetical protein N7532_007177 [Penicillium argentinense]KAJ5094930.1 hypothetical protein N7532_007221 [Penicillium argentinense]
MMKSLLPCALAVLSAVCAQANEWHAYYRLTPDAYQKKFDEMVGQGYRLNSVSGYEHDGQPNFAVIFEKKPSAPWQSYSGLSFKAHDEKFNELQAQGYHVAQVNGYTIDDKDYYAAVWDKSPVIAWQSRTGMSESGMQAYFNEYARQGYKLTHLSGYEVANETRFATVWEKANEKAAWWSQANLTSDEYQATFDKLKSEGYQAVDIDGYQVNGTVFYAGIWEKTPSRASITRYDLDSSTFQADFNQYRAQGYVLRTFSGYNVGKDDRYAAIWVKP